MVQEGIVLGHVVSARGIEVDRANVELIAKLPPPVNVKRMISLGRKGKGCFLYASSIIGMNLSYSQWDMMTC